MMPPRPATLADYKTLYASGYMARSRPWHDAPILWLLDRMPADILDVGGGSEHFAAWIERLTGEARVATVDPAFGGDPLPEINWLIRVDYVTCFDVLEHITESDIPACIRNLYRLARRGVVCSLSRASDVHEIIGEAVELHLTKQPADWWMAQFRDVFEGWNIQLWPLHNVNRFWITAEAPCEF